ncbi:MAG TPA: hypothetical protein PLS20_00575 [Ruminococcus flavefaciens]|nr:hypothetical protein [Ruminococcus flavefaciens]
MQGSGTISDPYIITNASELWSMPDYGDSSLYYALGCDIDLNGCFRNGNVTPIPLECAGLDGRGHRIRNLYMNDQTSELSAFLIYNTCREITIKDLIIENFKIAANKFSFFAGSNCNIRLYNCTIGAHIRANTNPASRSSFMSKNTVYIHAELCSFILRFFINTMFNVFVDAELKRCQVRSELICNNLPSQSASYDRYFMSYSTVNDCIFVIDLKPLTITTTLKYFLNLILCTIQNSYFDFSSSDTTQFMWNNIPNTTCFCIARTPDTTTYTGATRAYILTEAQAKDASYLESIGFDVTEE